MAGNQQDSTVAGGNARADDDAVTADDLSLVDDRLEDEGKDDAALWAEIETGEKAASDDDAAPSPDDKSGDGEDDDAASADFDSDDDSAAAGGDDDASSTAQRKPDDKSGTDGKTPSGNDDQIWANATQEQRAAFDAAQSELSRLKHAERSNRGRISALQRQLQDGTRQPGRQSPAGANSGQAAPGAAGSDFFKGSKWSEFRNEYPEIAAPLEDVIGDLRSQNTRLEKELSAIGDERRQSALDEQEGLLVSEHPDWEDMLTAENGFPEWLESQPRHVQEAAARNGAEIVDAQEAADVVGRFKEFVQAKKGGDSSAGNRNGAGNGAGNQSRLSGRRARQLESASSARANGPGVASGIAEDGDPEVIWDQFDKAERREARG